MFKEMKKKIEKILKKSISINMHNINDADIERCQTLGIISSLSSAYSHGIKIIV